MIGESKIRPKLRRHFERVPKLTKIPTTRRGVIAKLGLAGALLTDNASAEPVLSAESDAYLARFAGAIPRSVADRLADRLSVRDFGARGDGRTDDTQAFQAAATAAAQAGKSLFIPATPHGYVVTDTVELRVRRLCGEGAYLDPHNPGTLILFRPRHRSDMKPCFAIVDGMYGAGSVENLSVFGDEGYTRGELRRWIDPARLPDYAAFAPGACAFGVFGANQPTFRNVATRNVKAGLYLNSTDGHVSSYDCGWSGLFGVYCRRNSEDYFFLGGGISGVWAGVVFGAFNHANHNGGMNATFYRVHMGFSPYGFYQVKDAAFSGQALSLYGRLDVVRFEQIGEAIFSFLPESVTDALVIDSFGFSWSRIYRDYPKPPVGWACNLPAAILPYDEQQKFAMRFGALAGNVKLGWLDDAWPVLRSPWAPAPGGIASIERMDLGENADLAALRDDYVVASEPSPCSPTRRRGGRAVRQADLALEADICASANLLINPEVLGNWRVSEGAFIPARLADAGVTVPLGLEEELGGEPAVLKLGPAGAAQAFGQLKLRHLPPVVRRRNVCLTLWFCGPAMRCRLALSRGKYLYDATYYSPSAWRKVVCLDQSPGEANIADFEISSVSLEPIYICGLMASLDVPRPYTPLEVPSVRRGLALDDIAVDAAAPPAGDAAPPPERPAGYLTIKINGVDRKVAFF